MRPSLSMPHRINKSQRGAALMVMLVLVVLGIIAALLSSPSTSAIKSARQATTAAALAQAKDALIGYAITYGDTHSAVHGYLPCPDTDGPLGLQPEGSAEYSTSLCANNNAYKDVSLMGRLPWKTLDLPLLRDGNGECLWYAVSGTYKNNPKTDLMNWDNTGQFDILNASGVVIAQSAVAVVFAPGALLGSQNRAPDGNAPICGGNYNATNYLDSDGTINNAVVSGAANATSRFRLASSSQINDQMIFITQQDIWNAIQKRTDFQITLELLTQRVAECLVSYADFAYSNNKSLPWPALPELSDYGSENNYRDDRGTYAGRIPYSVSDSNDDMGGDYDPLSDTLFSTSDDLACPGNSSDPELKRLFHWWENWKDHLFYALSEEFKPKAEQTDNCGTCIKVKNSDYAAVVMFAGKKLSSQTRTNKSEIANYLEGLNASNVAATSPPADGNEVYQASGVSPTFNDISYCIKVNLSINTCQQ